MTGGSKTFTVHQATLTFALVRDGELIQSGTLKHRRVLPTLCKLFKYKGYNVIIQKGKGNSTMAVSKNQQALIDNHHYQALCKIEAGGDWYEINGNVRNAMTRRGFVADEGEILPAGLAFMSEQSGRQPEKPTYTIPAAKSTALRSQQVVAPADPEPAQPAAEIVTETVHDDVHEHRFTVVPTPAVYDDGLSFAAQMETNHKTRQALRQLRDSALSFVESVIAEKAPEVLPVLVSIQQANKVLSEWE